MIIIDLFKIQKNSQQIVRAIASIMKVEVLLIDSNGSIVAGTDYYEDDVGSTSEYNNIYQKLVESNGPIVIENPGEDACCKECKRYKDCSKLMEIVAPILIDDKVSGVISLIALDQEQLNYLSNNQRNLFHFLHQLGELMASKLIEQAMVRETENVLEQLNAVIDSIKTGILVADSQGLITYYNQAAEDLTGIKKSRTIGCHLNDIFLNCDLVEVLHTGKSIQNKEVNIQKDDLTKRIIISANPIQKGEEIIGVVTTLRGIHDFKKMVTDFGLSDESSGFNTIIGKSEGIKKAKKKASKIVNSSSSVLIRGESGTGKELFAKAIHETGIRKEENFISINCAAIPEELLESELFGHEAGSFTGASQGGKLGKFELANKGTIFLDEIGDMPLSLQAKLLKVIQNKSFYRIGGVEEISVDIRIISATNKNLEELLERNQFREDLFYRLNVIPLEIPPLRERKEDINLLIDYFIDKYNQKLNKNIKGITEEVKENLHNYQWPGNVRELENVIEYAINMETTDQIRSDNLPARIIGSNIDQNDFNIDKKVDQLEKRLIIKALDTFGWDTEGKLKAAKKLGIGKTTLYNKINQYNIK